MLLSLFTAPRSESSPRQQRRSSQRRFQPAARPSHRRRSTTSGAPKAVVSNNSATLAVAAILLSGAALPSLPSQWRDASSLPVSQPVEGFVFSLWIFHASLSSKSRDLGFWRKWFTWSCGLLASACHQSNKMTAVEKLG